MYIIRIEWQGLDRPKTLQQTTLTPKPYYYYQLSKSSLSKQYFDTIKTTHPEQIIP
jgi:hypothetical protein